MNHQDTQGTKEESVCPVFFLVLLVSWWLTTSFLIQLVHGAALMRRERS
jgi:hypothetical protein